MAGQSKPWALRLHRSNAARAGSLRMIPGVQATIVEDHVWVTGSDLDDTLLPLLSGVSEGPVFLVGDDRLLTPVRQSVPTARLPDAAFIPASEFFTPTMPPSNFPNPNTPTLTLKLVRSHTERPPEVWCGCKVAFREWGLTAPTIRLSCLRYAVSADSQVCTIGSPPPPLAGTLFWLAGQVAIPLGWHWSPEIDEPSLNEFISSVLTPSPESNQKTVVLWRSETDVACSLETIAQTSFIPTTRSSMRLL